MAEYPALHVDEYENSSILYLKPYDLSQNRVDDVLTKLRQVQSAGKQKILLDLRDVTDGDMDSAVLLANAFSEVGHHCHSAGPNLSRSRRGRRSQRILLRRRR